MRGFINVDDDLYPTSLKDIGDRPDVIFYYGSPPSKLF